MCLQVIGAPSFFPTVWGWINKWFDQNTVSKITIVPAGQELQALSELIDPVNIPRKYGGEFEFDFGMTPKLDQEIVESMDWLTEKDGSLVQDIPKGPIKWVDVDGRRTAVAVGSDAGEARHQAVMAVHNKQCSHHLTKLTQYI